MSAARPSVQAVCRGATLILRCASLAGSIGCKECATEAKGHWGFAGIAPQAGKIGSVYCYSPFVQRSDASVTECWDCLGSTRAIVTTASTPKVPRPR